ncbi:Clavaminate synthase-like protein [Fragilariopsis cylindrus CCMP1102]|uniref:Clavaminate synthase-like protein n=1 Tax=Fragilariopsis cylindrus CCMP1102 TaxID=635003 RepID=A0A1E7F0C7_9STRA|nr:Clavaminate synthase-like protein [Fragilariopsis cylindrus CCMP1102]|eukprot:OEU11556.1 Clavaminate synthase-like protein [Fragilariopsis cylindrus CCMP1102]
MMNDIPVIDLDLNRRHSSEDEIITELLTAFTTIGFCTIINHGISSELISNTFKVSKQFFDLPLEVKLKYKYLSPKSNRGYIPSGMETHDKTYDHSNSDCDSLSSVTIIPPDQKETMDIGYDDNNDDDEIFKNNWPDQDIIDSSLSNDNDDDDSINFHDVIDEYFSLMDKLYLRLMKYIGLGLGLPDDGDYLVQRCNQHHENLRLLHYPGGNTNNANSSNSNIRGNAHTDFGALTLLVQDEVGGLKVRRSNNESEEEWIDVKPVPNSIIVNVGDMLMRWSNDKLKATLHKVETPPTINTTATYTRDEIDSCTTRTISNVHGIDDNHEEEGEVKVNIIDVIIPERYSIAFFCNVNKDVNIECLETCCNDTDNPPKYPIINSYEYLTQRLAATIQTSTSTSTSTTTSTTESS